MENRCFQEVTQITTQRAIIISLRPKQWTKNLAVFAALLFSRTAGQFDRFVTVLAAFGVFCLLSGGVYVINDLLDLERDRKHPLKRLRPIASGRLPIPTAVLTACIAILISIVGAAFLGRYFLYASIAYLILQLAYSLSLKKLVILDVFSIAAGFVIRVIAGGVVISVEISHWLLICTMLLSLFLALSKRRHELTSLDKEAVKHRQILSEYSTGLLDQMTSIVTAATVVSYSQYTVDAVTVAKFGTNRLVYTVPFVLYGIFRYLYLVHQKHEGGSPDTALLTDGPLLTCVALYIATVWLILYRL
jgi:4-hydroxybenzoate polyprenyltransferase